MKIEHYTIIKDKFIFNNEELLFEPFLERLNERWLHWGNSITFMILTLYSNDWVVPITPKLYWNSEISDIKQIQDLIMPYYYHWLKTPTYYKDIRGIYIISVLHMTGSSRPPEE